MEPPPVDSLTQFRTLGFLKPQLLPPNYTVKNKSHFKKVTDEDIPFARAQGTRRSVLAATARYARPDVTVEMYGKPRFERNLKFILDIFAPYHGKCPPIPIDEVDYNADGAAGALLKDHFNYRNKEQVFDKHRDLVYWYGRHAHSFNIVPIWRTSGKSEILAAKKIMAESIRTFTFPDAFYSINFAHEISGIKNLMLYMGNEVEHWPFRMGSTFTHGGFHRMMSTLTGLIDVMGDATKWDASFTSVLHQAVKRIYGVLRGDTPGSPAERKFQWYMDIGHKSFVLLPNGQIIEMYYMKSGRPDTTISNCWAHFFILVDHFLDSCVSLEVQPDRFFLKCRWHIYADDHLNGYPEDFKEELSFEKRMVAYRRVGVELHPPPDDKIFYNTPVGATFLGATCGKKYGRYTPVFSYERMLAILYCNDYSEEDLEEVLVSVAPMVHTNPKCLDVFTEYVGHYYPHLLLLLKDRPIFSGQEQFARCTPQCAKKADGHLNISKYYISAEHVSRMSTGRIVSNNNTTSYDHPGKSKGGSSGSSKRRRNRRKRAQGGGGISETVEITSGNKHIDIHTSNRSSGSSRRAGRGTTTVFRPRDAVLSRAPKRDRYDLLSFQKKVENIVKAFIDPASNNNYRVPDGEGNIAVYQSKMQTNISGASGAAVAGVDVGRWSLTVSPAITDGPVFDGTWPSFSRAKVDGANGAAAYPTGYVANGVNARCTYTGDPLQPIYTNVGGTGSMDEVRCAGMSCLISYDGDDLVGGGDISAICAPGDTWSKRCTSGTTPATNNFVYWENISQYPKSYTGKTKKGTYIWWRPNTYKDMEMRSAMTLGAAGGQTTATTQYPILCAAGIMNSPKGAAAGPSSSMLVVIYTNYNFTPNDRSQIGDDAMDDPEAFAVACRYMRKLPTAIPNDLHEKFIAAVVGGVGGFLLGGPPMAVLGALSGFGIGTAAFKKI